MFKSFYVNRPDPVTCVPDTETKFVDQSEADRASLKYQLERYGMDSLQHQFEKTKSQFGYADTRLCSDFAELHQKMAEANSYFLQLPSRIRAQFNHSAVEYFSSIEKDPTKAYELGHISKSLAASLGVQSAIDKPIETIDPTVELSTPVKSEILPSVVESEVKNPSA